jgi:hypothetical protein
LLSARRACEKIVYSTGTVDADMSICGPFGDRNTNRQRATARQKTHLFFVHSRDSEDFHRRTGFQCSVKHNDADHRSHNAGTNNRSHYYYYHIGHDMSLKEQGENSRSKGLGALKGLRA